jgi:hypothetical protein
MVITDKRENRCLKRENESNEWIGVEWGSWGGVGACGLAVDVESRARPKLEVARKATAYRTQSICAEV